MKVLTDGEGNVVVGNAATAFVMPHDEALQLLLDLLDTVVRVKAPAMEHDVEGNEHMLTCPHCRTTFGHGEEPVIEVTYAHLVYSPAPLTQDLLMGYSGNVDTHTLAWLCAACNKAVSIPTEIEVTY